MDYLTKFYKNKAENLLEQLNLLKNKIKLNEDQYGLSPWEQGGVVSPLERSEWLEQEKEADEKLEKEMAARAPAKEPEETEDQRSDYLIWSARMKNDMEQYRQEKAEKQAKEAKERADRAAAISNMESDLQGDPGRSADLATELSAPKPADVIAPVPSTLLKPKPSVSTVEDQEHEKTLHDMEQKWQQEQEKQNTPPFLRKVDPKDVEFEDYVEKLRANKNAYDQFLKKPEPENTKPKIFREPDITTETSPGSGKWVAHPEWHAVPGDVAPLPPSDEDIDKIHDTLGIPRRIRFRPFADTYPDISSRFAKSDKDQASDLSPETLLGFKKQPKVSTEEDQEREEAGFRSGQITAPFDIPAGTKTNIDVLSGAGEVSDISPEDKLFGLAYSDRMLTFGKPGKEGREEKQRKTKEQEQEKYRKSYIDMLAQEHGVDSEALKRDLDQRGWQPPMTSSPEDMDAELERQRAPKVDPFAMQRGQHPGPYPDIDPDDLDKEGNLKPEAESKYDESGQKRSFWDRFFDIASKDPEESLGQFNAISKFWPEAAKEKRMLDAWNKNYEKQRKRMMDNFVYFSEKDRVQAIEDMEKESEDTPSSDNEGVSKDSSGNELTPKNSPFPMNPKGIIKFRFRDFMEKNK